MVTVKLPSWNGNLSPEKRLAVIDDVKCSILPTAREAAEEALAHWIIDPEAMDVIGEADYLSYLLTNMLVMLAAEEERLT